MQDDPKFLSKILYTCIIFMYNNYVEELIQELRASYLPLKKVEAVEAVIYRINFQWRWNNDYA